MPRTPTESSRSGRARRKPVQPRGLSAGFALASLVPILLALYLLSEDGDPFLGGQAFIVGLMAASAVSGFLFIRHELSRTFNAAVHRSQEQATEDLRASLRALSRDEIARIGESIGQITAGFEEKVTEAQAMKKRLREGLGHLAAGMSGSPAPEALLELLTTTVREALGARTAYFVGVDAEAGDFVTRFAVGEAAEEVRYRTVPLGEGVPGLAARERGPLLLQDLDASGKAGLGLASAPECTIAAPVHRGEDLQGVLVLHDREGDGRFDESDVALVAALTAFAGACLRQRSAGDEVETSFDRLIESVSLAIEARDPYARGHAGRVALYCEEMARRLKLDEDTVRDLRRAAYLHGVGRISLSETLLRKEDPFTEEELEHVRAYPVKSEAIIKDIPALSRICRMVRHHLERSDGSGGPDGAVGEEISLATHILIVANAFDAMTSDRSYRQARSLREAFRRLEVGIGKLYDERAVRALMELDETVLKRVSGPGVASGAVKGSGAASISVLE